MKLEEDLNLGQFNPPNDSKQDTELESQFMTGMGNTNHIKQENNSNNKNQMEEDENQSNNNIFHQ